ncbi:MAG TPA: hypothetical protein PLZ55_17560 [bacterium]|nr:hypothetical protein [bacterium]
MENPKHSQTNTQTPIPNEPVTHTTFPRRLLRWFVLLIYGVLGLIGTVLLICLIYVLFFLHYSQRTPREWQRKSGIPEEFAIPETCPVEEIGLNPYRKPDFEGYTIHRYRFTPETEEITEFLIDWFEPKGEKPSTGYPLVMNSPITGGGMQLENIFSRHFADQGMAVCLVHRPERYDREPKQLDQSGYWWRMMARQSRIAYRWALQRGEIDPARTASFGISNGGFRNTFFAAAEPNVRAHVICLAGGDLAGMLLVSDFFVETREEKMKNEGMDEEQLRAWLETVVDLETTDFAPYTDPDSVLMICARLDRIVPYRNGLLLWEAFGRPEFIALPFGHYSSAYFIPYIKRASLEFIQRRFESVP